LVCSFACILQILGSNPTPGKSLTLFAPFCADPVPDGPWPNFVRWCLAPRAAYFFRRQQGPAHSRSGSAPVFRTSPELFLHFSFSEISANMQNLLNPYLLIGNSKSKVFYMKFYQNNV
jgi:hypothetical protein